MADHDQPIKIRLIAILRLINPIATHVATEQDDFEDTSAFPLWLISAVDCLGELGHQERSSSSC
ncbi:hypothetical protein [Novosphingobium sp.]|uniref:hypothetical protein n=1 Tax=Novosphingobium sp. TaxID=1874826 RepID=UPI0031DA6CC1